MQSVVMEMFFYATFSRVADMTITITRCQVSNTTTNINNNNTAANSEQHAN